MMLPMSVVKVVDIIGSTTLIVLSLYALRLMRNLFLQNRGLTLYSYLYTQTIALSVFAISRSLGHIIKHVLVSADHSDIWKLLSPVSGSINSLTFVAFGLFAFLYSNVKEISERIDDLEHRRLELKASEDRLKKALDMAEAERAKTEAIIAGIGDGISIQDRDYRVVYQNEVHRGFIGSHVGKICYQAYEQRDEICDDCPVEKAFATGKVHRAERKMKISGETKYFDISASPIKDQLGAIVQAIEVVRDITERKKLESQLFHSQKMEAVGVLTGGIAHDFNNRLTAIIGFTEFLREAVKHDEKLRQYVDMVLEAAEKSATLTQSLLAFSRKQVINKAPVDINAVIRNVEKLLSRLIGEDISLDVRLSPAPIIVNADSGQLEQVFINLATNARDAMPEGGTLTMSSELRQLDEQFLRDHAIGPPGEYALITVSDTGIGMDERTKEQIFEPFFSTKGVGKGTGLGLAVVYGIVKQHDGEINVYSEPGHGSSFKIYLPHLAMAQKKEEEVEAAEPEPVRGTGTVLIAEDEESVRKLLATMLDGFGFRTIEAVDGEDAVRKFIENRDEIRLLLFDVMMPIKSGAEAYEDIRKMRPDIPYIFLSGYPADFLERKGIAGEFIHYVSKPVSQAELLRKIHEVFGE